MNCQIVGCQRTVSKSGHSLCYEHWKAQKDGHLTQCAKCQGWHDEKGSLCRECGSSLNSDENSADQSSGYLTSTRIGKHFGLTNIRINLILAELGWIEKYVKGWVPTDRGNALGANIKEMRNGTPFTVWPATILNNLALRASIAEQSGTAPPSPQPIESSTDFRSKFPATFRTQDGHIVRSRAEVLIDNWLYMQGLVHAYERRLPVEEECYCDFYLPSGSGGGKGVYIEFWGRESDPKYRERQAAKQAIYAKYGLRLIELGDSEIEKLDDVLPRMLIRFGIESA